VFQFRFQLFNGGEATLQVRWQAHGCEVFRDPDGLRRVPQGIFGDDDVLGLTEYDTNARLVGWVAQQVVDRREVERNFRKCSRIPDSNSRSRASSASMRKSKLYGSLRTCWARSDCGAGRVALKFVCAFP
jgi:hypothetical protein